MNALFTDCMREGLTDNWIHYADIYPNDMDVLIHSSLNVLITSVNYEDYIIFCIIKVYFCFTISSLLLASELL